MKLRSPAWVTFLFAAMLLSSVQTFAQFSQQGPKLVGSGAEGGTSQGFSVDFSADGNTAIVGGRTDNLGMGAAWIWTRSGGVWTQQGSKLVGTGASSDAQLGYAVALSADGNTAIVGALLDNGGAGAAWVWTRSAGVWTQQGAKLVGSGAAGNAYQGASVSLSADGNTAIIGGPLDNGRAGAAWVWVRSAGVWTQQGTKLVGAGATGSSRQGISVSLSADGNTALIGGDCDNNFAGAAWIWTRSGSVWTQQGSKLVGSGATGTNASQGWSVSLSADGATAIIGGPIDGGEAGAAWVWTRSGGVWTQQGTKLIGSGPVGNTSQQGSAVALSDDGSTAIVGGSEDNNLAGAAWVWTRSGGTWTQQGAKLVGSGAVWAQAKQGSSVSLSGNGNSAIVGGPSELAGGGAAWVWTRSGGVWTQQGAKLVGSGTAGRAGQGISVSISADGNTAIVGGDIDHDYTGAAWVWTRSGGSWIQQGPKLAGAGTDAYPSHQGMSVSLSDDGNTAAIAGPYDNNSAGAIWIWTRSGGVWTQQGPKLIGSGASGNAFQGCSVAISGDGNTVMAAGPVDSGYYGAAWVWTRTGGVWTQQGSKLVGSDPMNPQSVSLSGDGNTAIIGSPGYNGRAGAAWVWTRTNGIWSQQGPRLVGSGAVESSWPAEQGNSVALSADGNTAVVGGPADDGSIGAAWVWTRSGGVWTQQGPKLVGSDATAPAQFGRSVSLSADGNTAVVGGDRDNNFAGAAWVWTRNGSIWTQQGSKLVGSGVTGRVSRGFSVSLSHDGETFIAGGYNADYGVGAAWVFTTNLCNTLSQGASPGGGGSVLVNTAQNCSGGYTGGTQISLTASPAPGYVFSSWSGSGGTFSNSGSAATIFTISGNASVTANFAPEPLPNLTPYQYPGYSDRVVITTTTGTSMDESVFLRGHVLYVDWSAINSGASWPGGTNSYFRLRVDGADVGSWSWSSSWNTNIAITINDYAIGPLPSGRHYIELVVDATSAVDESDETDNVYGKWISVSPTPLDFDGDRRSDFEVVRPSEWKWYIRTHPAGLQTITQFGLANDKAVPADYDGDGKIDIAVWRPSIGVWYVRNSSGIPDTIQQWGLPGDVPAPADYDGDGKADMAVWRPSFGGWFIRTSASPFMIQQWGLPGDVPVPADYDGDGRAEMAVWRATNGGWYINNAGMPLRQWGLPNDVPLGGDFDGDGRAELTVWRPSIGAWYVYSLAGDAPLQIQQWGLPGDVPLLTNFDGDARADFTVWRPATGTWHVMQSSGGTFQQQWGLPADVPGPMK